MFSILKFWVLGGCRIWCFIYCLLCISSDLVMVGSTVNFEVLLNLFLEAVSIQYLFANYFPQIFTACSTVLVPARVVQALNLNLEEMMGAQPQLQPRLSGTLTPDGGIFTLAPISSCSAHLHIIMVFTPYLYLFIYILCSCYFL